MVRILELPKRAPDKFGHKRVRRVRKPKQHKRDQIDLFRQKAKIVALPSNLTPFEQALLVDDNQSPKARELYRHAIREHDCVADAYCNLGILESDAGRTEEAFDCFTKSLQLEPSHFESHFNIANLYFDLGQLRPSKVHYEIARHLREEYAHTYYNLGLVQALEGDLEGAYESLSRFQELAGKTESRAASELMDQLASTLPAVQ